MTEAAASLLHLSPDPLQGPGTGRFLIAFSGGADSTALAHRLAAVAGGLELLCIHIDHQLDEESGLRAERAQAIAQQIGLDCIIERVEVTPSASPEAAARKARHEALGRFVRAGDTLLMAHHRDDQIETVLLRLLRGSGPTGLGGIPALRPFATGWLMRPLLEQRRTDIHDYCRANGLGWVEDPANRCLSADRNFLRHRILPELRERWSGLELGIVRSARLSSEAGLIVEERARALLSEARQSDRVLRYDPLGKHSSHLQAEALRLWCLEVVGSTPPGKQLDSFLNQVQDCPSDRLPELRWESSVLRFWSRCFWLDRDLPRPAFETQWTSGRLLRLPEGLGELELRGDGRPEPWSFRVCSGRPGERIRPVGSDHHRRVAELMRVAGIPPWERDWWPRLYRGEDLLAVGGRWIDRDFGQHLASQGLKLVWRELESIPGPQTSMNAIP